MAMHRVQQRQLPLVLLGAGLPILPGLAGEAKSYAERLFDFPDIGAISEQDAGNGEKNFLRAMATLGPGACRTGDIAEALGVKATSLGPVRAKLIKKGMIFSPARGEMAFTVPLFDEFMIRAIP